MTPPAHGGGLPSEVEIVHVLSGERKVLRRDTADAGLVLFWPTVGKLTFSMRTGRGIDRDSQAWRVSEESRVALGLLAFVAPSPPSAPRVKGAPRMNSAQRRTIDLFTGKAAVDE